ncbi:MAG: DMT family transporter [Candidatus Altiarchaeota archaeon]|nr:DMT family transporter [Candidatus Altiarchaeota archaeon]
MDKEKFGTMLVLLTAIGSGMAIIVNRFFVLKVDPIIFTAIRAVLIGFVFLIISRRVPDKGKPVSTSKLVFLGLTGGGLAFWLFFVGLKATTGGRAAFIHKTLPIWAAIMAYFFLKEKITEIQIKSIGLAIVGLAIMQYDKISMSVRWGDMLVLVATLVWALESTLAKKFMSLGETNWRISFGRMFFGSLFLFGVAALQGKLSLILELQPIQWIYILVSTLMLMWYVLTWYWGLKYISLTKATGLLLFSPIVSLVLGMVFLSEQILPMQIIGSTLILVGLYYLSKTKSERMLSELS